MHTTRMLAVAALALVAACGGGGDDDAAAPTPAPRMEVSGPASVKGNVVTLPVTVPGIEIVKADGDTSGKSGHFHVFVDREPVAAGQGIPKEKGIVHSADNPIVLYGLSSGTHTFTVVVGDGAHVRIRDDLQDSVTVAVEGPAVQASAPPTVKPGEAVVVQLSASGLQIRPADGDTSGKSGHFHVFVDRDPTPAGQAIPKENGIIHTTESSVSIPGLAAGEHTLWVVAGDGLHQRLDPMVAAKLTVTVA